MDSFVDCIVSIVNMLISNTLFGIPLLGWAFIPIVVKLVFSFIKRGSDNDKEKD